MQAFRLHIISEHLHDRHPYLDPPFQERLHPSEVHLAVQARAIPKLIEILLMPKIQIYKYRDALITLNELVSHQQKKNEMISQGLVGISSAYLHSADVQVRRQAALLLGSLSSIIRVRTFFQEQTYKGLGNMLFDKEVEAKQACGWSICRIVTSRIGVQLLTSNRLVATMISSFMKHSQKPKEEQTVFIIYLLEAFSSIFQSDDGIEFALGKGFTKRLNLILKNEDDYFERHYRKRINYLSLDCLSKIAQNTMGKEECIDQRVIDTAKNFLNSEIFLQKKNSLVLIMFCAINLKGKKQCIYDQDGINRSIIQSLYCLLINDDPTIKSNCVQTLRSISQLKDGFLAIASQLGCHNKEYLQEIFGPSVVIAISDLLPKPSSLKNPPIIDDYQNVQNYKDLCKTLCYFIKRSAEALAIALEETVEVVLKIVLFMIFRGDKELQEEASSTIVKICNHDPYSLKLVKGFLQKYGKVQFPIINNNLEKEFQNNESLRELLKKA